MQFDIQSEVFRLTPFEQTLLGDRSDWQLDDAQILQYEIKKRLGALANMDFSTYPKGSQLNTALETQKAAEAALNGMLTAIRPFVPGGLGEEIEEALRDQPTE